MRVSDISPKQFSDFVAIERTCSSLSLVSCIFIISTFLLSKSFRKPITRLVFFASFGNLMTNVATLMARTFVDVPDSPGCQLQAFLIQMFMPADAFWTLAMAVNVYLTFYRKYDAEKLKKMEFLYLFICYGAPFIVALTYVFIHTPARGKMYGNALLWCWVSSGWDIWRIATFYAPVWVAIFITFFIYIRTGRQVYRKYKQLRSLTSRPANLSPERFTITEPFSTRTTEVYITSEVIPDLPFHDGTIASNRSSAAVRALPVPAAAYSVTITSDAGRSGRSSPQPEHDEEAGDDDCAELKSTTSRATAASAPAAAAAAAAPRAPTRNSLSLPTLSSLASSGRRLARPLSESFRPNLRRQLAVYEANSAAWSYARCALLFFTALLITWIPSTANRVYSLARHGDVCLGLQYASAFVLPLQGFWNGLIYVFTTRKACAGVLRKGMRCLSRRTSMGATTKDKRRVRESLRADLGNRFSKIPESQTDRHASGDSDCLMLRSVPSGGGNLPVDRLNVGPLQVVHDVRFKV